MLVAGGSLGLAVLAAMTVGGVTYTGGACTRSVGNGVVEELAASVGLCAGIAGCVGAELGDGAVVGRTGGGGLVAAGPASCG